MKKIKLLVIVALVGLTISLSAQNRENRQFVPEDVAKQQTETLKKEINLTSEQEPKIETVYLKYAKKQEERMKAIQGKNRNTISEEERTKNREEMRKTMDERDKEIKAIVTTQQYEKYEIWRDEQNKNRQRGRN